MRVVIWFVTLVFIQASVLPLGAASIDAASADVVRLEALMAEVLANNPELLAARKRWEAAQQKIPLAKSLPAPRIGIEFEEIPRGTVNFNQATLMYQLIQSLPFPGKLSLRHQVAVKEAQVAAMAFKQTEWELISQLKAAYYELVLLDRERELQAQQRMWLVQAVEVARTRYAAGQALQIELLRAESDALEAATALDVLAHRQQAVVAHLNHLLNRSAHDLIGQPASLQLIPLRFSADELALIAQERQPELLAFKYSAERAEASWRLAKRELLPDLETMVELRDPAMGPVGSWDLTLALVIPFWFWTKWKYGVKAALYDKESAQAAYQSMRNEITKRIHEHWHEAMAAYATARLCQESLIGLSEQAVRSAMAAYQTGRGSMMELLEVLRALAQRQRTYIQHAVNFEQHVALLEQAVGMSLQSLQEGSMTEGGSS